MDMGPSPKNTAEKLKDPTDEKHDETEEEEVEENQKQENSLKNVSSYRLKNKMTWPILSDQVLNRLVKHPYDHPSFLKDELEKYAKCQEEINFFRERNFDVQNIVDLDASQHPDVVFDNLKNRMLIKGYSIYNPVIIPKKLYPLEGGFKGY